MHWFQCHGLNLTKSNCLSLNKDNTHYGYCAKLHVNIIRISNDLYIYVLKFRD